MPTATVELPPVSAKRLPGHKTDGRFNYTYDNEGNVTRQTRLVGGAMTDYTWDHRNRLSAVIQRANATGPITQQTT